jgi:hypothetical protein
MRESVRSLADEMSQSMLEGEKVIFQSNAFRTSTMQLDEDASLWLYEEHGDELQKLAGLIAQYELLESRRVIPDIESQLQDQHRKIKSLMESRIADLCIQAAQLHTEYGEESWRPMVTKERSISTGTQSTDTWVSLNTKETKTTLIMSTSVKCMSIFNSAIRAISKLFSWKKPLSKSAPPRSTASL